MRRLFPLLFLLGCFRSDAQPSDASVDGPEPGCGFGGTVVQITCPAVVSPGVPATASFQVRGACCRTETETTVTRSGDRLQIAQRTQYCDCPGGGPTPSCGADVPVTLPPLEAGRYTVAVEGFACSFEVASAECRDVAIDELRAPRAVFESELLELSAFVHDPGTCACTPELREGMDGYDPSLCGCCDECDCIDRGFELGWRGVPPSGGVLRVGDVTRPFGVFAPDVCRAATPTALRIVGPEPDYRGVGPRLFWAVVSAAPQVCCGEPFGAVRTIDGAEDIDLELRTCHEDPCPCIGPETPFDAWHSLGELADGTYRIRVGDLVQVVTVADGRLVE
ncbi:MAG: hypothetical protein H6721_03305 [Sandaracinus sp.]|nr:hypothetical protein [Sandaracinus sp.]MCB9631160.1 hypothetical protein [Sandaracinus sp.]